MTSALNREALEAEAEALRSLLETEIEGDPVRTLTLTSRLASIEDEIHALEDEYDTLADVAVLFEGEPVSNGAIESEFAANAIQAFQDLVAKDAAVFETGGLGQRGPVPSRSAFRLNISGIARGSFGFILQESDPHSPQFLSSSLRSAVDHVMRILEISAGRSEDDFSELLDEIDERVFKSTKNFVSVVHNGGATMKFVQGSSKAQFQPEGIRRAFERVSAIDVEESDEVLQGRLLGVLPMSLRFEFQPEGSIEVIKGETGPRLSKDYLERIENDEQIIGQRIEAHIYKKLVTRAGGKEFTSYKLLDFTPISEQANE